MNGLAASIAELEALIDGAGSLDAVDLLLCPPFTLLQGFAERASGSRVAIGAQDCHPDESGAHTGDVSAEMVADAGARAVIVGHSERRQDHGEDDALVREKLAAARRAGLAPIVCVGESEAERDAGCALAVVREQLRGSLRGDGAGGLAVAYEPVWAIGTGRTAEPGQIEEVHASMREALDDLADDAGAVRILYGGSVKPGNARDILALEHVDGALVGGASLKAADFLAIANGASGSAVG